MKTKLVEVPTIKQPIQPSPGFHKKQLSEYKLDVCGLCQFGCAYCSSNAGNYLRINRSRFADLTEKQTGQRGLPAHDPSLMFVWPDVLGHLERQLSRQSSEWGAGLTLVFSMLTDGFSPRLVTEGITEAALRLVLERTQFRIRVLTKNAIVGTRRWIKFFESFPGRFVVGLSIGSLDDDWARCVESFTPVPSARLRALTKLQDAGIPTFGMLCPTLPDALANLDELVARIRPDLVEHIWAEPFNDRQNWHSVRAGYPKNSKWYRWFTETFERSRKEQWSRYATDLYVCLRERAERQGWLHKLRFLLYEQDITASDAIHFTGLKGVLLQSKPHENGLSRNRHLAEIQRTTELT